MPMYRLFFIPLCVLITLGLAYLYYQCIEIYTERFRESIYEQNNGVIYPAPAPLRHIYLPQSVVAFFTYKKETGRQLGQRH